MLGGDDFLSCEARAVMLTAPKARHFLGALLAVAAISGPAGATSFGAAVRLVAAEHPRVGAAAQLVVAARADVNAARAPRRPQVSIVGDAGYERRGLTARDNTALLPGVRVSQLVFDGGRVGAEVRRRKFRAEALGAERDMAVYDVVDRLAQAYLEWARQRALLSIAEEQVVAFTAIAGTVRAIAGFDRGRASDVALVETRLAQAETTRDGRLAGVENARAAIRQAAAADIEPEGEMITVAGLLPATLAESLAAAEQHPAIRSAQFQSREADALADAAAAWWKPQVSLDAGATSESDLVGRSSLFGAMELKLRMSLAPIDGGGGSSRLASARASASASRMQASFAGRSIRDEITRTWVSAANRRARLPKLTSLVGVSDASRSVVLEQFRIGRRSILDVLTYELERFAVRTQVETERRDLLAEEYRLLSLVGGLVGAFGSDDGAERGPS